MIDTAIAIGYALLRGMLWILVGLAMVMINVMGAVLAVPALIAEWIMK